MAMLHFAERELPQAAFLLGEMGAPKRARAFLIRAAETAPDMQGRVLAARLAQGLGQTSAQVMIARLAGVEGEMLIRLGWPIPAGILPAGSPGAEVGEGVILSITRQESSFDPDVVSHSGAVGLMQLLPGTAHDVARKQGIVLGPGSLRDPTQNIALGTAYFASLMRRFGEATPLAIAAYNAGPHNVEAWLADNGDPRMPARAGGADIINWIEEIPFGETRNYVERVVEGIVIYRALLGKPAINPITRWMAAR